MSSTFKDLRVWQDAMKFVVDVYRVTSQFARHELYGLSQQLRRAFVSIPSNIAEGGSSIESRVWKFSAARKRFSVGSANTDYDCPGIRILNKPGRRSAIEVR